MRRSIQWLLGVMVVLFPMAGHACEPIVPLFQLLSGSTLAGPAIITKSMWWLLGAVLIKTFAFVWFERSLSWGRAAVFMIIANVVSTIPGVFLAAFTTSMSMFGIFLGAILACLLGAFWEARLARLPKGVQPEWLSHLSPAVWFFILFFASGMLYGCAAVAVSSGHFLSYWMLKYAFVTISAASGILISAILEESVIARMTRQAQPTANFFPSVLRANYITLGTVLFVVAMQMLPKRLRSPDFLTTWLQSVLGNS